MIFPGSAVWQWEIGKVINVYFSSDVCEGLRARVYVCFPLDFGIIYLKRRKSYCAAAIAAREERSENM